MRSRQIVRNHLRYGGAKLIKKSIFSVSLALSVLISGFSGGTVFANGSAKKPLDAEASLQVSSKPTPSLPQSLDVEGVSVAKHSDGRVEPILNAENLTSSQLNSVLREMN